MLAIQAQAWNDMYEGERFNGMTHLAGLALAIAASGALIHHAVAMNVEGRQVIGSVVFAASMIAVYASSALYHCTRGRLKALWAKTDHCAIYLLIAGTYTPLSLGPIRPAWGAAMCAVIWLIAGVGIARELRSAPGAAPSLPLYLGMGWLGVIFAAPAAGAMSADCLGWLVAGALLYTVGTVFYMNDRRWRHAHGIWHLFVIGGSACHFVTVFGLLGNPTIA
jgi:hemolysin III